MIKMLEFMKKAIEAVWHRSLEILLICVILNIASHAFPAYFKKIFNLISPDDLVEYLPFIISIFYVAFLIFSCFTTIIFIMRTIKKYTSDYTLGVNV